MNHVEPKIHLHEIERMSSSDGEREAHAMGRACASRVNLTECAGILHDLEHVIAGMLINAQVMEWKLPPYSHAKRYVREIERSAQRGAELVKQVVRKLETAGNDEEQLCGEVPGFPGTMAAVTAQEPNVGDIPMAALPLACSTHAAPDFSPTRRRASHSRL
jgi:hypothetical protein